jgi:hypothetical protein
MPAVEVPITAIRIGSVEVFDEVVSFADEEVVCEHDTDETAHEDSHSRDTGEEDGA